MPPRKRARVSQATSPEPEPQQKTPTPTASPSKSDDQILHDPWTDDEETGLFKGLMRWKPTGIHKHFRLLALHAWLLENNYIHPRNAHTKPAGIWAKLNTLYDLSALDAREDARQLSPLRSSADEQGQQEEDEEDDDADVYSVAANKIYNEDFDLNGLDGDFDEMMWKARFPNEPGAESDTELPDLNMADDPPIRFVPSFSIEPSEAATPSSRTTKAKSSVPKKSGKAALAPRRSSRRTESVADKDEEVVDDTMEENDEAEDDEDDENESGEEDQSQASTSGPRRGRSSKATKGKPVSRPKGKGRRGK